MTSTEVALPSARIQRPDFVGQATAVEQARAVAEVAAAVQVAQQFPRDLDRVRREMHISCSSLELAREAFYAVKNRGQGPSVHLARELAMLYGNFQSGVHELRRDDAAGESEVQSFAWDVERNTRQTRTFIQPHARMKDGKRVALIDLQDIYLSNQNIGARALRECIFGALPKWLVREAEALCRATLEKGDGRSVAQRADAAVNWFAGVNVTEPQLVAYLDGRKRSQWTPQDIAALEVINGSITRGDTTADEHFKDTRVTGAEIMGSKPAEKKAAPAKKAADPPAQPADEEPRSTAKLATTQSKKLHAVLGDLKLNDERDRKLQVIAAIIRRPIGSTNHLTRDEAKVAIDTLESVAKSEDPAEYLASIVDAAREFVESQMAPPKDESADGGLFPEGENAPPPDGG